MFPRIKKKSLGKIIVVFDDADTKIKIGIFMVFDESGHQQFNRSSRNINLSHAHSDSYL